MTISASRERRDGQHFYRVCSRNGGPIKLARWEPSLFVGDGGWYVEGRADPLTRDQFNGNYTFRGL